jgi:hypothetical protein
VVQTDDLAGWPIRPFIAFSGMSPEINSKSDEVAL